MENRLHRNSQKRFYHDDKVYYIVTKTYENFPFFKEKIFCELFIEELKLCKRLKEFELFGFSIIPDHVNLLIRPGKKYNISEIMKSLKENASRDINYIINDKTFISDKSTCRLPVREAIKNCQNRYKESSINNRYEKRHFEWQKSFYDHVIRNNLDFTKHYNYTVYNYIKHGLPEDWRYSSKNYDNIIDIYIV